MKKLIFLGAVSVISTSAYADKLVCELSTGGKTQKIEGLSEVSITLGSFLCRAKKEEGEMIRLRINSTSSSDVANEHGYRNSTETLYSVEHQGQEIDYATCTCNLQ